VTDHYPFVNTPLPYAYDALEPHIDTKTMHLHHDRHLQGYIDNLNAALQDQPGLQSLSLEGLICSAGRLPAAVGTPVSRNAGGVYNHRFFFDGMTPEAAAEPAGALADAINRAFGGFDAFADAFKIAALSVFGSGYAWLVADRSGRLRIVTSANQETPLTMGFCPVMNLDVWEHAYYLKHYNKRGDYVGDWFRVVDWKKAEERYVECLRCARP